MSVEYIYIAYYPTTFPGAVKIGRTTKDDPLDRVMEWGKGTVTGLPEDAVIYKSYAVNDSATVEKAVHKLLKDKATKDGGSEWFTISKENADISVLEAIELSGDSGEESELVVRYAKKKSVNISEDAPDILRRTIGIPGGIVKVFEIKTTDSVRNLIKEMENVWLAHSPDITWASKTLFEDDMYSSIIEDFVRVRNSLEDNVTRYDHEPDQQAWINGLSEESKRLVTSIGNSYIVMDVKVSEASAIYRQAREYWSSLESGKESASRRLGTRLWGFRRVPVSEAEIAMDPYVARMEKLLAELKVDLENIINQYELTCPDPVYWVLPWEPPQSKKSLPLDP